MSYSNTAQGFGSKFEVDLVDNQERPLDSYLALANLLGRVAQNGNKFAGVVKVKMNNPFSDKAVFGLAASYGSMASVTLASVQAADTVTVNGREYTAVSGAKADNTEFDISGTNNEAATDLVDSINNDERAENFGKVMAITNENTVNLYQVGKDGDGTQLASSNGTRLNTSAATFTGAESSTGTVTLASAQANDTVTVNGREYTAVSGTKADNTEFDISGTNAQAATDLADSINNDTRDETLGEVFAVAASDVVTIYQVGVRGDAGDDTGLESSNGTRLAVSGSGTFTGGGTSTFAFSVRDVNGDLEEFVVSNTYKPAALTAGRAISLEIQQDSNYTYTARSLKSVLDHIQSIEDEFEQLGGDASADTATDLGGVDVTVRGGTPSESFVWNIEKIDNAYILIPTADS